MTSKGAHRRLVTLRAPPSAVAEATKKTSYLDYLPEKPSAAVKKLATRSNEEIYEIIGAARRLGKWDPTLLTPSTCPYEVGYSDIEQEMREEIETMLKKATPVKGMYKCKYCGFDEFYVWSAQTRGGDEGMTVFRSCGKCGKRGKE